ncbi:hypothetical protein [Nocardiopsis tropica]|uniref:Uncharacterized protein n=1 Tax=Nocardiopsis tropica TaxID=109330 RepID=A0ABU7KNE5_9ACTN|nr:hypothetical protein [Nocardiopsis umidischolae]MEE2050821.1 hypothetical protein [Nocardiopsis umidischolae]
MDYTLAVRLERDEEALTIWTAADGLDYGVKWQRTGERAETGQVEYRDQTDNRHPRDAKVWQLFKNARALGFRQTGGGEPVPCCGLSRDDLLREIMVYLREIGVKNINPEEVADAVLLRHGIVTWAHLDDEEVAEVLAAAVD